MTVLDLRGADAAIRGAVGTDLEVSITFTDSAGDPVDVSGYTVAADVIRDTSTVVDSFASAVSGAGSNVLTLTLTDSETTAIGIELGLKWRLNMTASGSTEQWIAGEFRLFAAGHPRAASNTTSLSVQVSGAITATVQTPLPLATLDGRFVPPATTQSGTTYTVDADDNNSTIVLSNSSQVTVTLPTDASDDLVDGFRCLLFAAGAGGVTLSTSGLTLLGSSPNTTIAQNEGLYVEKTATANTWLVVGGTS